MKNVPLKHRDAVSQLISGFAKMCDTAAGDDIRVIGAYLGDLPSGRTKRHVFKIDRIEVTCANDKNSFVVSNGDDYRYELPILYAAEAYVAAKAANQSGLKESGCVATALHHYLNRVRKEDAKVSTTACRRPTRPAGQQPWMLGYCSR